MVLATELLDSISPVFELTRRVELSDNWDADYSIARDKSLTWIFLTIFILVIIQLVGSNISCWRANQEIYCMVREKSIGHKSVSQGLRKSLAKLDVLYPTTSWTQCTDIYDSRQDWILSTQVVGIIFETVH